MTFDLSTYIPTERALKNRKYITEIQGLPSDFPHLHNVEHPIQEDKSHLPYGWTSQLDDRSINEDHAIYVRDNDLIEELKLQVQKPLLGVLFRRGHGCTTIHNLVYDNVQRVGPFINTIPVKINLDDYLKSDTYSLDIERTIKTGILRELFGNSWDVARNNGDRWPKAIPNYVYADIMGLFGAPDKEEHMKWIESIIENPAKTNQKELAQACPLFGKPLNEVLEYFQKYQIKVTSFFDIPHDIGDEHFYGLVARIKDMDEERINSWNFNQVYFMTRNHLEKMQASYPRTFEIVDYNAQDGYTPPEIYRILDNQNTLKINNDGRKTIHPVITNFDSRFVELAYSEEKTLHEIMSDVEKLMLERLDCDKKDVPLRLEPTDKQIERWKVTK